MGIFSKFDSTGTRFTQIRYGKDLPGGGSTQQPFIRKQPVDSVVDLANTGGIGWFRGGSLITPAREDDLLRFRKFFSTAQGRSFVGKQNALSRIGVKTQASFGLSYLGGALNEGIYNPLVTEAQVRGAGSGLHLTKNGLTGLNPTNEAGGGSLVGQILGGIANQSTLNPYSSVVTNNQPTDDNRLIQFTQQKINSRIYSLPTSLAGNTVLEAFINFLGFSNRSNMFRKDPDPNTLTRYSGGPGSFGGAFDTVIGRYSNTNDGIDFSKNPNFEGKYYVLNPEQISNIPTIGPGGFTNGEIPQDFRRTLLQDGAVRRQLSGTGQKDVLSKSINYERFNLEARTGLGNPGRRNKNTEDYNARQAALDKINSLPIFRSTEQKEEDAAGNSTRDLINFRIGVQNNANPNQYDWIYFRSFIESMSENYNAQWDNTKYAGRAENFYYYQGFTRNVTMNFNVMALSLAELKTQYRKLNFLASSLAPSYSPNYMQGNLIKLNVGDYFINQFGFITDLSYNVDGEAGWEIGIGSNFNDPFSDVNPDARRLPKKIDVQMSFTPIEKFRVEKQTNEYFVNGDISSYGEQKFISPIPEPSSPVLSSPSPLFLDDDTNFEIPELDLRRIVPRVDQPPGFLN